MPKTSNSNLPSICNNFVFTSVMKDKEICKGFLECVLGIQIAELTYAEEEKTMDNREDQRGIRTDVYAKDIHGNAYDIEMQCRNTGDLPLRSRYYHSMMDNYMLDQGESYRNLKHSMVIFVCTFDLFHRGASVYVTKYQCLGHPEILLDDKATTIYLNTKGLRKDLPQELTALLDYFETARPSSNLTNQMQDSVTRLSQDREWRQNYMTIGQEIEIECQDARAEGRAEGKADQLFSQITKKLAKGKSLEEIAEEVEEPIEVIQELVSQLESKKELSCGS